MKDVVEFLAAAKAHARVPIPTEGAEARPKGVTDTAETHDCRRTTAHGECYALHLVETSRDECCHRVRSKIEAFTHASSKCNDILHRTADFEADHVRRPESQMEF